VAEIRESSRSSPEFAYQKQQLRDFMDEAAGQLNEKQRTAFTLRDIEGCKVDDVAQIMDMPEATVRWYLHRARSRIRKELLRRCPHLLALMGLR
jgi:RNA polymerase sigma-70 factor (ECF subfamily)